MREISPVLAGTFDRTDYTPAVSNFNRAADNAAPVAAPNADNTNAVTDAPNSTASNYIDPRRYTKFDRTASQVADAPDFSFGDFLDMINPLQHIPVISSVYRSITGESINPVSRVAGDVLYGGALGAVSAVVGGVSAVADAVSESQTGKDTTGVVLASLFGDDSKNTQVADAAKSAGPVENAAASAEAPSQTIPKTDDQNLILASTTANANAAQILTAPKVTPVEVAKIDSSNAPLLQPKAFPLNKQAFGGVMAPTANDIESQNRIIALSQGSHAMRLGHTIYTNPLMNGAKPLPVATPQIAATDTDVAKNPVASTAAVTPATETGQAPINSIAQIQSTSADKMGANAAQAPALASANTAQAQHNPLPQNLIDDMIMMKAISQYKGVASNASSPLGTSLDISN